MSDDAENTYTVAFYITMEMWEVVEQEISDQFRIYPNPATEILYIETPEVELTMLEVIDITGKVCHSEEIQSVNCILNTSALSKGVYLVRISGKEGTLVKMFVKE